jgi:hypothetical protein
MPSIAGDFGGVGGGGRRRLGAYFSLSTASLWIPPHVSSFNDINTLIASLGGNSGFVGFYDRRVNVTGNPNVTAWADARTVSPGTTLAYFGSGTNPTVSAAGSPISFTTGGATLGFTTGISFNGTSGAVVGIASSTYAGGSGVGTTQPVFGIGGSSTDLYVGINTTPHWTANVGATTIAIDSGVASSSTIRTVIAGVNSTTGSIQVEAQAAVTSVITSGSNSGTTTVLGGFNVGSTSVNGPLVMYAFIILNFVPSAAQSLSIAQWANAVHGAVNA